MPRRPQFTDRQKLFVAEYPKDLNMTRAAERAGYKHPKQLGTKLMSLPHVKDAIIAGMERRVEKVGIDAEWVLRNAVAVYHRVVQEVKPALHPKYRTQLTDDDGNKLFTFDSSAALRALELVGKHVDVGAFEDRVTLGVDQELINILQEGRKRAGLDPDTGEPNSIIDVTPEPAKVLRKPEPEPAKVLRKPKPVEPEPMINLSPEEQWRRDRARLTKDEMIKKYPGGSIPTPTPLPRAAQTSVIHEYDPYEEKP